jgi:chemotaxis protein MotB
VQTANGPPGEPTDAQPVQPAQSAEQSNTDPTEPEQQVALVIPGQKRAIEGTPAEAMTEGKPAEAAASESEVGKTDQPKTAAEEKPENGTAEAKLEVQLAAADKLKAEIEQAIGGAAGKLAEGLLVTPSEGGLLVTISDQSDAAMFNVGSAVPRRELVLAMERLGKLLQGKPGQIVIRGHTDGRQFRGTENDNWRLSMARAHSAYYMLVRGGLSEERVEQVSGFADRRLQVPDDPLADSNRRIEILVEAEQG